MEGSLIFIQRSIEKSFKKRLVKSSGRNFLGRICVFHQGGGRFTFYRAVDFSRRLNDYGRVIRLSKNPSRTAMVASLLYLNGLVASIIAVDNLTLGTMLFSGSFFSWKAPEVFNQGSAIPLRYVNMFSQISCCELAPFQGLSLFRSAGVSGLLVAKDQKYGTLKCSSGWYLKLSLNSLVTLGRCSNVAHWTRRIPNAGFNRKRGIRPTVRGVVKNPCDHPHGGGEGKGSPPAAQLSPWSKLTKGTPTTKKKWAIVRRRQFKLVSRKSQS